MIFLFSFRKNADGTRDHQTERTRRAVQSRAQGVEESVETKEAGQLKQIFETDYSDVHEMGQLR